jgi:hypothetical protein
MITEFLMIYKKLFEKLPFPLKFKVGPVMIDRSILSALCKKGDYGDFCIKIRSTMDRKI